MRCFWISAFLLSCTGLHAAEFRVLPYVQNPSPSAMTVRWLSETQEPGTLTLTEESGSRELTSSPVLATTLGYNPFAAEPGGPHAELPWLHSLRVNNLKAATEYRYSVTQGTDKFSGTFRTSPATHQAVRLIAYADSETEPESSSTPPVGWPVSANSNRPQGVVNYLVDQTIGYRANCRLISERRPDLLLVVGDLVECGGEQRDWDEFWRHNAGGFGSLASGIPILPAIGNHENYGGPGGGYTAAGANFGTDKYLSYFEVPDNGASNPKHKGRYYRLDYGPLTLITLDSSDGLPHKTAADTNHNLEGSNAPDFNPGSEQYQWLEAQLEDARKTSAFVFVQFHHTMFGSGPHSIPFGEQNFSGQSGIAMRVLLPLFMKHGVDLVLSGHDEMLERSEVSGEKILSDGRSVPHTIHFFDVGIGGDGLRGPSEGFDNPYRKFLAHDNAPEVWKDGTLISGGKHYGHLEIDVRPVKDGGWILEASPVYVFPQIDRNGQVFAWERRVYDDVVRITKHEHIHQRK